MADDGFRARVQGCGRATRELSAGVLGKACGGPRAVGGGQQARHEGSLLPGTRWQGRKVEERHRVKGIPPYQRTNKAPASSVALVGGVRDVYQGLRWAPVDIRALFPKQPSPPRPAHPLCPPSNPWPQPNGFPSQRLPASPPPDARALSPTPRTQPSAPLSRAGRAFLRSPFRSRLRKFPAPSLLRAQRITKHRRGARRARRIRASRTQFMVAGCGVGA